MDEIAVSTVVYLSPDDVYDFLLDFPGYANYSKYLTDVAQHGDGGPGTRYSMRFRWWKITYTARSEVTGVTPPERIDFRIIKDIDGDGCWRVEPLDSLPADAPADATDACRVHFEVAYDATTVRRRDIDLPRFVSLGWVVDRVKPLLVKEAERVVERVVADIEGRHRSVELTIRTP